MQKGSAGTMMDGLEVDNVATLVPSLALAAAMVIAVT